MNTRIAMIRINTRVEGYQKEYIKTSAKAKNVTEGDIVRAALDRDIEANKLDF